MRLRTTIALLLWGMAGQANELVVQRQPVVVYVGSSSIVAGVYYKRLERRPVEESTAKPPEDAGVKSLAQQLPLMPTRMKVGKPALQVQQGQVVPLFIIGMDRVSLNWFSRATDGLADIGARGVVVQAARQDEWQVLQQNAKGIGIDLMLLSGDSLAEGYKIDTYPVVIVSPELAEEGFGE